MSCKFIRVDRLNINANDDNLPAIVPIDHHNPQKLSNLAEDINFEKDETKSRVFLVRLEKT